jgi:hypothetical protein
VACTHLQILWDTDNFFCAEKYQRKHGNLELERIHLDFLSHPAVKRNTLNPSKYCMGFKNNTAIW